jgi:uncharacterized protein (TIGR02453 family)
MILPATLQFLKKLSKNNNRDWFHAHKAEYDAARGNVIELVSKLMEEINRFDKIGFHEPRKALFRIARDTRFSHDKSPYKQNFGFVLNANGSTTSELSSYYVHIEPGNCFLSCGIYMPAPDLLKALRCAIDDDFDRFLGIITEKKFAQAFGSLARDEDALVRVPVGFDKNSPAAEYLKLRRFYVAAALSDKEVTSSQLISTATRYFERMQPLNHFLNEVVLNY